MSGGEAGNEKHECKDLVFTKFISFYKFKMTGVTGRDGDKLQI